VPTHSRFVRENTGNFQLGNHEPPSVQFRLRPHGFSIVLKGIYSKNMMNLSLLSRIGCVVMLCLCCWHQCLVTVMAEMYHCREANVLKKSYSSVIPSLQEYWVFWTFPSSGILETRKQNVLETGSSFRNVVFSSL
jgi:hypothetical protein